MQRTSSKLIFKNVLVNPFMTDGYIQILLHPPTYLFWTPFFANQLFNIRPGAPVNTETNLTLLSILGKGMRLFMSIASSTTIPFELPANRRFVDTDYFGNLLLCLSCFKQRIYSVSLFQRELAVSFHLCTSYLVVSKVRSIQPLRFFYNHSLSCT